MHDSESLQQAARQAGWNPIYSVGIPEIDDQHIRLFLMIRDLGNPDADVQETLSGIAEYTKLHFELEERLMKSYGYPEYGAHVDLHETFVTEVGTYLTGASLPDRQELRKFLRGWLMGHILKEDKLFGEFAQTQKDAAEKILAWKNEVGAAEAVAIRKKGFLGRFFGGFFRA